MTTVKVRNIVLGEGLPKIAVPNVGVTEEEILASAKEIAAAKPDIMEWRIDYYEAGIKDNEKLIATAKALRDVVGELPILVTFRTKNEGGVLELGEDEYLDLVATVVTNRLGDAVDIELFHDEERVKDLVKQAHNYNVVVIMSNHDFEKVPAKDVIEFRLKKMADLGADVPKLACMPHKSLTSLSSGRESASSMRSADGSLIHRTHSEGNTASVVRSGRLFHRASVGLAGE